MNILYVIPNLNKVSGGPKTRISMFKRVFLKNNDLVVEKGNKLYNSLRPRKINRVYVESATNRIGLVDLISLFFLRLYAKDITVFIRDIYIELFPDEYRSARGKITLIFNKLSNFYLTLIATSMVFPTKTMGQVFFEKNRRFPRRKYTDLPPGTVLSENQRPLPDFNKKLGILYLGSTRYSNSGFENFVKFALRYVDYYHFFVLSGDKNLNEQLSQTSIKLQVVPHHDISDFIKKNNIAFAMHTRPRNQYDDLTFPIKVLDFISLYLPFFTEKHIPLVDLMGTDYDLFIGFDNFENIHHCIQNMNNATYSQLINVLQNISIKNTYDERYKKLFTL